MVAGLALAYVTVRNVALTAGLFESSKPIYASRPPPLVVSILQIISLPAIPLGILVALIGLLIFLGTSSAARWGVALAAVATLLLIIEPFDSYFFLILSHDASPGYGAIATMLFLSRALSVLSSLLLAAGIVLLYVADQRDHKLGAWGMILPAIAVAAVLSSAAPFALAAVGLAGGTMLADLSQLATGFLWVALGVALWPHAPENQNVGTTPLTS
jgi:hypothetical protein